MVNGGDSGSLSRLLPEQMDPRVSLQLEGIRVSGQIRRSSLLVQTLPSIRPRMPGEIGWGFRGWQQSGRRNRLEHPIIRVDRRTLGRSRLGSSGQCDRRREPGSGPRVELVVAIQLANGPVYQTRACPGCNRTDVEAYTLVADDQSNRCSAPTLAAAA